jgi:hypothetical protein
LFLSCLCLSTSRRTIYCLYHLPTDDRL